MSPVMSAVKARGFAYFGLVALGALATGCAIHVQGQVKEVAYDFSDRDFYDRAYAPSPRYEDGYLQYRDADVAPVAQAPAPAREEIMLLAPPGGLPLEATTAAIGAQGEAEGGLVREPAAY